MHASVRPRSGTSHGALDHQESTTKYRLAAWWQPAYDSLCIVLAAIRLPSAFHFGIRCRIPWLSMAQHQVAPCHYGAAAVVVAVRALPLVHVLHAVPT